MSDRVTYAIQNGAQRLDIDAYLMKDYTKLAGWQGMGVAPTILSVTKSVRGGGYFRGSKRDIRQITAPIAVFGNGRQEIEDKLRRLTAILNDQFTTPYLLAQYLNGDVFAVEVHYQSGTDPIWGQDTDGRTSCSLAITLQAKPYWESLRATQLLVRTPGTHRGLIRTGSGGLSRLALNASQAFGVTNVVNSGDVEAWPTWQVFGPGSSFVAQRSIDGAQFSYSAAIAAGNPITFDTSRKTVLDSTGANAYGNMGSTRRFFSLPPGTSSVMIALQDATADSYVVMTYFERRELVF